jgi:hypothetical protein
MKTKHIVLIGTFLLALAVFEASAFYDPALQRWINRDPIHELGGKNLFSSVLNNPVSLVDKYGLDPDDFNSDDYIFMGNYFYPKPGKKCPKGWHQETRDDADGVIDRGMSRMYPCVKDSPKTPPPSDPPQPPTPPSTCTTIAPPPVTPPQDPPQVPPQEPPQTPPLLPPLLVFPHSHRINTILLYPQGVPPAVPVVPPSCSGPWCPVW